MGKLWEVDYLAITDSAEMLFQFVRPGSSPKDWPRQIIALYTKRLAVLLNDGELDFARADFDSLNSLWQIWWAVKELDAIASEVFGCERLTKDATDSLIPLCVPELSVESDAEDDENLKERAEGIVLVALSALSSLGSEDGGMYPVVSYVGSESPDGSGFLALEGGWQLFREGFPKQELGLSEQEEQLLSILIDVSPERLTNGAMKQQMESRFGAVGCNPSQVIRQLCNKVKLGFGEEVMPFVIDVDDSDAGSFKYTTGIIREPAQPDGNAPVMNDKKISGDSP